MSDLTGDLIDTLVAELNHPASDRLFLLGLAHLLERTEPLQFPDDPECQQVTDLICARLRKMAQNGSAS